MIQDSPEQCQSDKKKKTYFSEISLKTETDFFQVWIEHFQDNFFFAEGLIVPFQTLRLKILLQENR